jgi:hypothetical protein
MQKCVHLAQGTQMSINSVSKACGFMDSNIELCSSRENKVKLLSARIGIHVAGRADAQSIYLSALICCYVLSGLPEELAEQRARFKLMEFRGSEDNFLAVAVVAYRLTFERVFGHLPHGPVADATAVGSKHAVSSPPGPCDSASGGLPLKQVKKHECPLDDLDDANAAGVKVSRRRVRWLDLEKSAGVDAALPDRMQADRANIASVCEQAPSVAGGGEAGLCARWLQEVCAQLGSYEGKLLRRHVPSLSQISLEQLVGVTNAELNDFLSTMPNQPQTGKAPHQISKMAMRRVLQTALDRVAASDNDLSELRRHWHATADKSSRKGKEAASAHRRGVLGGASAAPAIAPKPQLPAAPSPAVAATSWGPELATMLEATEGLLQALLEPAEGVQKRR